MAPIIVVLIGVWGGCTFGAGMGYIENKNPGVRFIGAIAVLIGIIAIGAAGGLSNTL